jgi:ribulose-phosphate 3-epimerase
MLRPLRIAPSILASDFARLGEEVRAVDAAGADWIHVDVMDGHFVPNLTIGPPVMRALNQVTTLPLDVHLMIDNVDDTIGWYLDAGASYVSVHVEACKHLHRVVGAIRAAGAAPGVSLNPATPIDTLADILPDLDYVLLMSVNPGFGGQSFIPHTVDKVQALSQMASDLGTDLLIQVDGGIDTKTAPLVAAAGARCLVAGNAVFGNPEPAGALMRIRAAAADAAR